MTYPIKFLSLQKAELQYEVELRGGSGESVQELRREIVKLSQLLPSEDISESHLSAADDLKEVKESLLKSQNNLTTLKNKFDRNMFNRTETLLHHIYHRINRIVNVTEVNDIYKVCVTSFNSQFKEMTSYKAQTSQSANTASPADATNPSTISVTCERSLTQDIIKIKYNGNSCVHSFIQKVEEFVYSRNVSPERILSMAYEIFEGDALHWFRYNKDQVNSWSELRTLLRKDFSSSDYDYKLAAEIRSRTQGEQENITIYLSIMHGMFSRLTKPMTEDEKLDILLHNIRPCYANTLAASANINTIESLKSVCRNYENVSSRFSNFQEPPRASNSTIAPEFSYKYQSANINQKQFYKFKPGTSYNNTKYNNNESNKHNFNKNFEVAALNTQSRPTFCPRCRSDSHSLNTCRQTRFPICFKCGKKDVRYPECPDCHPETTTAPKN